jgi:hypothetical protein
MNKHRSFSPFVWALVTGLVIFAMACTFISEVEVTKAASTVRSTPTRRATVTDTQTPTPSITPTVVFRPIKWMELVKFLEDDHTNWNTYDPVHYTCLDFAVDLVANARKQNLKAWIVLVKFKNDENGHAFVAFETSDHGIMYIEPQGDNTYMNLSVGQRLCDTWGVYQCMGIVESIQYAQCDHDHRCTEFTP